MGIGPVAAIPLALKNAGLQLSDVDLFEVRLEYFVLMSEDAEGPARSTKHSPPSISTL